MLEVAAKLECRRIARRTARGHADAKAKGVKFRRTPSLTAPRPREARERLVVTGTRHGIARGDNVNQATISRLVASRLTSIHTGESFSATRPPRTKDGFSGPDGGSPHRARRTALAPPVTRP